MESIKASNSDLSESRMPVDQSLKVLASLRRDDWIVITHQGSVREWSRLSQHPRDFHYLPSTMGGAVPLGLGLARARPREHVVVITGDGSLLMNLGSLVTVAACGPENLTILTLDNGVYEVTGGQATAGQLAQTRFADLARAAGFTTTAALTRISDWQRQAAAILQQPGPRFISLAVQVVHDHYAARAPEPMARQVERLTRQLGTG